MPAMDDELSSFHLLDHQTIFPHTCLPGQRTYHLFERERDDWARELSFMYLVATLVISTIMRDKQHSLNPSKSSHFNCQFLSTSEDSQV